MQYYEIQYNVNIMRIKNTETTIQCSTQNVLNTNENRANRNEIRIFIISKKPR